MNWSWFIALVCATPVFAFYHERSTRMFTHPLNPNASFGFSISSVSRGPTAKLVVGAPLADKIGQIYTCDLTNKDNNCTSVDNTVNKRPYTDELSLSQDYWFGATVLGTDDFFVGCAPRSVDDSDAKLFVELEVGTYGHCFLYKGTNPPKPLKSLSLLQRKENFTRIEQTMDSLGWSLFIGSEDSILVGGPAMLSGRIIKPRPNGVSYVNGSRTHTTFNYGYAVASGKFLSLKNSIAVGSPYGTYGLGSVSFLAEKDMTYQKELIGPAVGSMFGAVLCPAKLKAAGLLTDLLVGAPTFIPGGKEGNGYDYGAVYVYIAGDVPLLKRTIVGESSKSHFGSAIVSLGDLNHDNIDEIAIAAPYENDGQGMVYLYSGADIMSDGTLKLTQTITPESPHRSFGYSLTVLRDYDDNGCNELAIGAPESNKVMVLRCMATIGIELLEFDTKVSGPNGVDKTEVLKLCFNAKFPDKPKVIKTDIIVKIKIQHNGAKLLSPADGKVRFKINHTDAKKNEQICDSTSVQLFLSGSTGDYNQKIGYVLSATLQDDPMRKDDFASSEVILNKNSVLSLSGSIWAQECGDRVCVPNLNMTTQYSEDSRSPLIIGSSSSINVWIKVDNLGEVAYDACVRVVVTGAGVPGVCKIESANDTNKTMLCKPKQLLRQNSPWTVPAIALDTTKLTNEDKIISVTVELYEDCKSNKKDANMAVFKLIADAESVKVHGRTDEGQDDMVNLTRTDISMRKTFEHIYTISNSGPTNWINIKMILTVQKQDFVTISHDPICKAITGADSDESLKYSCFAPKLDSNAKIEVKALMQVVPDEINDRIDKEKLTVYSEILIFMDETSRNASVTSELILIEVKIPIWIIIVASILALIILFIIFLILRECGFLKRKNKQNLKQARMSVRRQTIMRQSSSNRPQSQDHERLVDEAIKSQENKKKKKDRRIVVNDF